MTRFVGFRCDRCQKEVRPQRVKKQGDVPLPRNWTRMVNPTTNRRGHWCPECSREYARFAEVRSELRELDSKP